MFLHIRAHRKAAAEAAAKDAVETVAGGAEACQAPPREEAVVPRPRRAVPPPRAPEAKPSAAPQHHDGGHDHQEQESQALAQSEQALAILAKYRSLRSDFGFVRLEMGSYLHLIRENALWKGLAENWEAFLAAENINAHAARQYITVAKKFILEMDLPEETLRKLAAAGITALEKASRVINQDNQAEIISALVDLSEKDAIQRIKALSSGVEPELGKPSLAVLKLLREFHEMPPDMQMEFLQKVNKGPRRNRE